MKHRFPGFLFVIVLLAMIPVSAYALNPPKDLVGNVLDDNSVTLTWTSPMDANIAGFNIYRKDDTSAAAPVKANKTPLTGTSFVDSGVSKGKSYSYTCRSVGTDGIESEPSNSAGAPKMLLNTSAVITHMGKPARIATPGDIIKYNIAFANRGFGIAKNVMIIYAIPKGTTFISGTAKCPRHRVKISYFDESIGNWVSSVTSEQNISRVKFTVMEDVIPLVRDNNDVATLKVMVNY